MEPSSPPAPDLRFDDLSIGFLLGLLVGEGHFGGDGRQPQVTLRMHVRHRRIFDWLTATFPGGRLYGPYHHGGRDYYQWMARGDYLRRVLAPLVAVHREWLDDNAAARFDAMCAQYRVDVPAPGAADQPRTILGDVAGETGAQLAVPGLGSPP